MQYASQEELTTSSERMSYGIINAGSTCYINTCMTALGHCPSFLDFVQGFNATAYPSKTLMNECVRLYKQLWDLKQPVMKPTKFLTVLHEHLGKCLDIYDQNDLGEFLVMFLDKLNSNICVQVSDQMKYVIIDNMKYRNGCDFEKQRKIMDDAYFDCVKKEYSELIPMFYGQNVTQIVCGHCGKIHHNYEMFSTLMLPLNEESTSLQDCMERYFQKEMLTAWKCDTCKETAPSCKTVLLWRTPDIMIFVIKRFKDNMIKNNKKIEVPLDLNIGNYSMDMHGYSYKLKSVGFHVGSFLGGHYYSVCKHPESGSWYMIDDLDVREVNPEGMDLGHGYVYFYERA